MKIIEYKTLGIWQLIASAS